MNFNKFLTTQLSRIGNVTISNFHFKVFKVIKYSLMLLIGGVIVLLCSILYGLIKIRFGRLYTSRVGHLCANMDNYISNRRKNSSKEIGFFCPDKHVANITVLKKWNQCKGIYISKFTIFPLFFLQSYLPNSKLLISFDEEMGSLYTETSLDQLNINISTDAELEKICLCNNLNQPFVCFHNRDSEYIRFYGLDKTDKNDHGYRDFEFDDYKLAIEYLSNLNINSIRIGDKFLKDSEINGSILKSFAGSNKYDFELIQKCLFFVGGNSGISCISRILRKPQLLVNYIPFEINRLSMYASKSIVLPKKLFNIEENRYLKFSEIANLPYSIHYDGNFFKDMGLRIENNSEIELRLAVNEMYMRIKGQWKDTENQVFLQTKLWESLGDNEINQKTKYKLEITIASTYLELNSILI